MTEESIIIIGGPSRGKSTLAHEFHLKGYAVKCGDPLSKVVYSKPYTTYLPEDLDFAGDGGAAAWVAENWFPVPKMTVCEGHVMSRALRRWLDGFTGAPTMPADRIIVLDRPAHRETSKGQEAMHTGVMRVWSEIADAFDHITEYRT